MRAKRRFRCVLHPRSSLLQARLCSTLPWLSLAAVYALRSVEYYTSIRAHRQTGRQPLIDSFSPAVAAAAALLLLLLLPCAPCSLRRKNAGARAGYAREGKRVCVLYIIRGRVRERENMLRVLRERRGMERETGLRGSFSGFSEGWGGRVEADLGGSRVSLFNFFL